MTALGWFQVLLYVGVLLALVKPLGTYMARVFEGQGLFGLDRLLGPIERSIYRVAGVDAASEMRWQTYAGAVLLLSLVGLVFTYGVERLQGILPANPQGMSGVEPGLAFNTAASFTTNTNWQNYGGETTMSYLTQMLGLTIHNFFSAATGIAVLIALIRGLARKSGATLGNFWVDVTRCTLYILLPLSVVFALALVSQGVLQNFSPYKTVPLVQGTSYTQPKLDAAGHTVVDAGGHAISETVAVTTQTLPMGPAASQIAIKHLGTNGGGFFNANSAHPFENPTALTDFLEVLAQTVIAAALCYTFGKMVGDTRQGWAVLAAMLVILAAFIGLCYWAESGANPHLAAMNVDQAATEVNPGGNMEGKEARLGVARSALFATCTTATSCGAVDSMHDSFMPLGGAVPMAMMELGEVVLGGTGTGLYGMLVLAIIAVFIAGLMVGRTPEYLGKKIEAYEMKMAALLILIMPAVVLILTGAAVVLPAGLAGISNPGAHGFSEILYAFASATNNNGSAFAGLSGNTTFYNSSGGVAMLIGRFWTIVFTLALAGSLVRKKVVPAGAGTLPTHTPLFVTLLIGVVLIVALLTFVPALAVGPVVEHLQLFGR
ncbi:MAG TPA: potassium-transporting ATPase subunit KdpA [Phycisphaerae bacterium]|nr:potassium-transporting ATPase subunit KdpA [Phycisphaerae bacterium]